MFKRILKFLLGVFFFPVCVTVSMSLYEQLSQIRTISYYNQKYFVIGIVAYLVVHALFFKPAYLYILGHEIMHVLATWLSGGKVTSFKVSSQGGSVATSKSNLFIALAPYFFPFYTIITALLFFAVKLTFAAGPQYNIFIFLLGFTLCFHIILTVDFLKMRQTDLLHAGYLFSICLIYVVNLIIVGFIFSLLFERVVFLEFIKSIYFQSKEVYAGVFSQLFL